MATPLLMAYSIARQVVLPADLMSRPWPEQVEVIRATIERHYDPQIVTPFGRVVSYRFRTVSGEAVRFDTAGNLLTLGSSPNTCQPTPNDE